MAGIQDKFRKANVIYKITSDIDLGGTTIAIPVNCVLDFQGGKITNGAISLNKTLIWPLGCNVKDYITATVGGTYREGQTLFDPDTKKYKFFNGTAWKNLDDLYRFRMSQDGRIQSSDDGGSTWTDISAPITNNVAIQGYVNTSSDLPANAPLGSIYMVGTTTPYYMYIKSTSGWVNNGSFTSVSVPIVSTIGRSVGTVMNQAAVSNALTDSIALIGKGVYKGTVATVAALTTTFPNAQKDWAALVSADGCIYRYDGTKWDNTGLTEWPASVPLELNAFTPLPSTNIDSLFTKGVYIVRAVENPFIVFVYAAGSIINQCRMYMLNPAPIIQYRSFVNNEWTAWTNTNLTLKVLPELGTDQNNPMSQYAVNAALTNLTSTFNAKSFKGSTNNLDEVLVSGVYVSNTATFPYVAYVSKISDADIRQLRMYMTGTVPVIQYRNYNGTSWSGWSDMYDTSGQVMPQNYMDCVSNIQWYGDARIYWNAETSQLQIIGNVPSNGNNKVVARIFIDNSIYKIINITKDVLVRSINLTDNKQLLLPIPASYPISYTLDDIVVLDGTTYNKNTHIKLAHIIFGSGVSDSPIIKQYTKHGDEANYNRDPFDILKTLKSKDRDYTTTVFWGDSIFGSGFKDTIFPDSNGNTLYEQPPRCCTMQSFNRELYYYLNGNKHTWRNANHANWTYTGVNAMVNSSVMPNSNAGGVGDATQYDKLRQLQADATATITLTGAKKVMFFFQGGRDAYATGDISVRVKVDNGATSLPSEILKGAITKKGFGNTKVCEVAKDTIVTKFTDQVGASVSGYNRYSAYQCEVYNGLDENKTYTFTLTASSVAYLWGCCYTKEDIVHLVYNNSKPGFSWTQLKGTFTGDLIVPKADLIILQAPMYHDKNSSDAEYGADLLLPLFKNYNMNVILCSCPPGGVIITGRATTILGDENAAAYYPGQNFVKYFNGLRYLNTTLPSKDVYPVRNEIYQATISGVTYNVYACAAEASYSTNKVMVTIPDTFPSSVPNGTIFTKISNIEPNSIASFTVTSMDAFITMNMHRDIMYRMSVKYNLPFVDLLEAFDDMANSVGEKPNTDGWQMSSGHPLYQKVKALEGNPSYPGLREPFLMNYMSNFFDIGDGHHLQYPAHEVIWEILKNKCFDPVWKS